MPTTILAADERPATFVSPRRAFMAPREAHAVQPVKPAMTRVYMLCEPEAVEAWRLTHAAPPPAAEPTAPSANAQAKPSTAKREPKAVATATATPAPAPQPTVATGLEAKMLTFVDHQVSRGIKRDDAERQALAIVANGVSPHSLADKDARALAWAMLGRAPRPRQDGDDVQARPRAEARVWDARPTYNATVVRHARQWYGPNTPHSAPVTVRKFG